MPGDTIEQDDSAPASPGLFPAEKAAGLSSVEKKLAMTGGVGTDSYAQNSSRQGNAADKVFIPFYEKALECVVLPERSSGPSVVRLADLGCSSGSNAIEQMSRLVQKLRGQRMHTDASKSPPECQAFFCDLPSNDFNTLFELLTKDKKHDFFLGGTPGSFYGRLFPRSSINVFYSTYGLHFLSKIPDAVLDKSSPAFNKGGWWLHKDTSSVARRALREQAAWDLQTFLHARAIELSPGGVLMFVALGQTEGDPEDKELIQVILERLGQTWRELAEEGTISQETAESLYIPYYTRSMKEVSEGLQYFSSAFSVHHAEMANVKFSLPNFPSTSTQLASLWRPLLSVMVEDIIGKELSEVFWDRATQAMEVELMPNVEECRMKDRGNVYLVALKRKENGGQI